MPKLLFFVNRTQFFLSHRLPIAIAAMEQGYDVHVGSGEQSDIDIEQEYGIKEHTLKLSRSKMNPIGEVQSLLDIFKLLKKIQPDIIHNVTIKPVLYGSLLAKLFPNLKVVNAISGLGYIFIQNGKKDKLIQAAVKRLYRFSLSSQKTMTIFQNPDDREFFIEQKMTKSKQTVLIKGSGVNLNQFHPNPRQDFEGEIRILLPARMLFDKGVQEFVDAAKIIRNKGIKAVFLLAGEIDPGNPKAVREELLIDWHNQGIIEWLGFQKDMSSLMHQSDIVCLPSYREGLPKSLLEGLAAGKPIVTTDVPGCREVVISGFNGILVPAKNAQELAEALELLINHHPLRQQMGMRSRVIAEQEFSIESVVNKTTTIYNQLLAGNRI